MSNATGGTGSFGAPFAQSNPRWVVPADCPECGAPVDQAVQSHAADPVCEYCHKPLPSTPFVAAPQPNVFTPFRPQRTSGPFGAGPNGYPRRYPFPLPRRRSHWVVGLFMLAIIGVVVAVPLAHLIRAFRGASICSWGRRRRCLQATTTVSSGSRWNR